jgi:hypothetical protein
MIIGSQVFILCVSQVMVLWALLPRRIMSFFDGGRWGDIAEDLAFFTGLEGGDVAVTEEGCKCFGQFELWKAAVRHRSCCLST